MTIILTFFLTYYLLTITFFQLNNKNKIHHWKNNAFWLNNWVNALSVLIICSCILVIINKKVLKNGTNNIT